LQLPEFLARRATRQLMRYAIAGFCVTQCAAFIYSAIVLFRHVPPLQANVMSTVCGWCAGYVVHSRWSFAGGEARDEYSTVGRFVLTSSFAFLVNTGWVWLLVSVLHLSPLAPVPMMMFVTPWVSFLLNRYWVFKAT
jgi:putative flippase GtrA